MAEQYTNDAVTTLAGAITSGATSLTVTSATGFPTTGNFRIRIDGELLLVTAVSGATWTVTRAIEAVGGVTLATAHANGATVTHVLTAASLALAGGVAIGATISGSNADGSILWQNQSGQLAQDAAGMFFFDPDGTYGPLATAATLYIGGPNLNEAGYVAFYDASAAQYVPIFIDSGIWYFAGSVNFTGDLSITGTLNLSNGSLFGTISAAHTAATGALASLYTNTTPNDGFKHQYTIGGVVKVTSRVTDVLALQVAYTDQANTAQTLTLVPLGTTSGLLAATGTYNYPAVTIWCYPNTSVTVKTTLTTGGGSILYDVATNVTQLT